MSLEEILLGGGGVLLAAMTLIQVAPIKVNPWSAVAKAIGRAINGEVIAKVDQLKRDLVAMKAAQEERDQLPVPDPPFRGRNDPRGPAHKGAFRPDPAGHNQL